MCGICGCVGNRPVESSEIDAMTEALRHRGPDGSGTYFAPGVGLGHRRLAIIDVEHGQQPIANEDESTWIVFNGAIYNHQDLRTGLIARGHRFRSRTDAEVVLHLYEDRGIDCVQALRGMFAFAIWDSRTRQLFAARDRFGQKPFFYTLRNDQILFASEIKALLHVSPALVELDREALDQYLALRIIAAPKSMFRRVRKLPAAHRLVFDPTHGVRVDRYWQVDFQPKLKGREDQLEVELVSRLKEALRLHLIGDFQVGAFLSGGLDSSLIVALLSGVLDGGAVENVLRVASLSRVRRRAVCTARGATLRHATRG